MSLPPISQIGPKITLSQCSTQTYDISLQILHFALHISDKSDLQTSNVRTVRRKQNIHAEEDNHKISKLKVKGT